MDDLEDPLSDLPVPNPKDRRGGNRFEDEPGDLADSGVDREPFEPNRDLPGAVLMVPNRQWGFEVVSAADHPGACTHYLSGASNAILVKGTDAEHVRYPHRYFFAEPTEENGLHKITAFELVPRRLRLHRLKLFFPERYLGRLAEVTLHVLRAELARLHPEE